MQLLALPAQGPPAYFCTVQPIYAAFRRTGAGRLSVQQENHPPHVLPQLRRAALRAGQDAGWLGRGRRQRALPAGGGRLGTQAYAVRRAEYVTVPAHKIAAFTSRRVAVIIC